MAYGYACVDDPALTQMWACAFWHDTSRSLKCTLVPEHVPLELVPHPLTFIFACSISHTHFRCVTCPHPCALTLLVQLMSSYSCHNTDIQPLPHCIVSHPDTWSLSYHIASHHICWFSISSGWRRLGLGLIGCFWCYLSHTPHSFLCHFIFTFAFTFTFDVEAVMPPVARFGCGVLVRQMSRYWQYYFWSVEACLSHCPESSVGKGRYQ
jgi:hypothetical protein